MLAHEIGGSPSAPAVVGRSIWARIGDRRQRSFVTGYLGWPPGFQNHEDIRRIIHVGRRQRVADGGQTSVPWRLSRSVIDSLGPAGAEFARIAEYALGRFGVGLGRSAHRSSGSCVTVRWAHGDKRCDRPAVLVHHRRSGAWCCRDPFRILPHKLIGAVTCSSMMQALVRDG
jgi:hypothetical protein